jgi:hypothetical protein
MLLTKLSNIQMNSFGQAKVYRVIYLVILLYNKWMILFPFIAMFEIKMNMQVDILSCITRKSVQF